MNVKIYQFIGLGLVRINLNLKCKKNPNLFYFVVSNIVIQ